MNYLSVLIYRNNINIEKQIQINCGGINNMANTMKTKIRLPISSDILEAIRKQFQDVFVEETGVYTITRGFELHHLLIKLSKEYGEELIAEHSSSADYYSTLYIEQYKDGKSKTIVKKTGYVIFYEDKYRYYMTESVYSQLHNLLDEYSEFDKIRFLFYLHERYRFTVSKAGNIAYVEVEDLHDDLTLTNECLYINKSLSAKRIVDKRLITALNLGAIGQSPRNLQDDLTLINKCLYINKSLPVKRVVDKRLIPALNLGAIGQNPKKLQYNKAR